MAGSRVRAISICAVFPHNSLPFVYLGCPIFQGLKNKEYFQPMVEKIRKRIIGWRSKVLSTCRKLILIKHVFSSVPIYLLSVVSLPKKILKKIKQCFVDFFF
ncbi:hypothetical protein ACH5RR_039315 [Cinchona calisaya]|uniref:Uncharacterized protein n=1 Tax=Cinchona calisaya TaxID=153742 RepID=A0ABD2Y308_9GENT